MSRNIWRTKGRMNFPLYGLEYYLPLWHSELSGSPITAKIPLGGGVTAAVTGATHNPPRNRYFVTDDFIDLGNDRFDALSAGTILMWVNFPASGALRIFGFDVDGNNRAFLTKSGGNKLASNMRTGATQRLSFTGDTTLNIDTDYLLCFANGTDGNRFSINGVAETGSYSAGNAATDFFFDNMATGTTLYSLGRAMVAGGSFEYGNVYISDLWIYNRKLDILEDKQIYESTRWRSVQ